MIRHAQAPDSSPDERYYASAEGLRLYYRDYPGDPQATPVLCLPGLTRNSRDFADLAHRIAPLHRVVTPDLRGRGRSERDPDWQRYVPARYLDDIRRLLAHAGIRSAVVIGTSLGGLLAIMMASERRAAVRGVVLNDVGPEIAPQGFARIKGYIGRQPAPSNWSEAVRQCREVHGSALPDFSDSDWERYARRCYREVDGTITPDFDPAIGEAARGAPVPELWAPFAALRSIPTVVLRGALSDVLSRETVAQMAARIPDLLCVEVPRRGHVPQLDEPECVAAIEQLLRRFRPHKTASVS